jgi:hypothetical protein
MRIVVLAPPAGVSMAVQRGRGDLLPPSEQGPAGTVFEFSLRLGAPLADGGFNYLGEYAHGTPADRFVYINSGTPAGQAASCWTRRAKLKLAGIPRDIAAAAIGDQHHCIEARFAGTGSDGGPVCATIKPAALAWALV